MTNSLELVVRDAILDDVHRNHPFGNLNMVAIEQYGEIRADFGNSDDGLDEVFCRLIPTGKVA